MIFRRCAVLFLATGGYVGRLPKAPGTFGSLLGLPVAYALEQTTPGAAVILCMILIAVAVWVSAAAERQLNVKDPGCIVIDEIAGMTVALFGIPLTLGTGAAGFILFRFLDILKPPPIRVLERRLSGGWGIVMDDIAAGVMVNIMVRIGLALSC